MSCLESVVTAMVVAGLVVLSRPTSAKPQTSPTSSSSSVEISSESVCEGEEK